MACGDSAAYNQRLIRVDNRGFARDPRAYTRQYLRDAAWPHGRDWDYTALNVTLS